MSKNIKLAMIRTNNENNCPFGLPIIVGCKNAGNSIDKMAPLEIMGEDATAEEKNAISVANNHILRWQSSASPCKYAQQIISNKNAVNCSYKEGNAEGEHIGSGALTGSDYFWKQLSGNSLDGFYSNPRGISVEAPIRDIGSGPFSIEGISSENTENKIKK